MGLQVGIIYLLHNPCRVSLLFGIILCDVFVTLALNGVGKLFNFELFLLFNKGAF